MQPAKLDLDLYRGDTWKMRVKLYAQNMTPIDLTDTTAKAQIRDRPSGDTIIPLDCTITLPNEVELVLTAENSFKLSNSCTVWDLQISFLSGEVKTPLAGQVSVTPDVTDSTPFPQPV
jgi:hypothetical protein